MIAFAAVGRAFPRRRPTLAIVDGGADLRRVNLIERSEIRAGAKRSPPCVPDRGSDAYSLFIAVVDRRPPIGLQLDSAIVDLHETRRQLPPYRASAQTFNVF